MYQKRLRFVALSLWTLSWLEETVYVENIAHVSAKPEYIWKHTDNSPKHSHHLVWVDMDLDIPQSSAHGQQTTEQQKWAKSEVNQAQNSSRHNSLTTNLFSAKRNNTAMFGQWPISSSTDAYVAL